jgi:hypothetical protein
LSSRSCRLSCRSISASKILTSWKIHFSRPLFLLLFVAQFMVWGISRLSRYLFTTTIFIKNRSVLRNPHLLLEMRLIHNHEPMKKNSWNICSGVKVTLTILFQISHPIGQDYRLPFLLHVPVQSGCNPGTKTWKIWTQCTKLLPYMGLDGLHTTICSG